ncbi:methionine biosynthesis PLP-dependent protein [Bacillus marinisedimentorum]|uniref:methionine biosynthesis PLP-dependent protein n=1 Tax=Bacillus marinisedimentorum TaxID=1821260 RepID=UPI000871CCA9|nr:methionine biosynthesis PLP-dependent protein [Bacillus marinisedimentorum]
MGQHTDTILAQIGNRTDEKGAVNHPVYFSTAYRHEQVGQTGGYDYTRTGNPTREVAEDAIARLENGDEGFAFSSGMAAIQALICLFAPGDELLVSADLYGGTYRLFETSWKQYGINIQYGKTVEDFAERRTANTKAVFLETPTNPLMEEVSIREAAEFAKEHGLLLIVDNTFYTPILQKPLDEGADIVIHSATKYLGGHNDVLAGLLAVKGEEICGQICSYQNTSGAVLSPFDSWLLARGMKTLSLRMERHEYNAKRIAAFLAEREEVTDVLYPGRGGMLSFRLEKEEWVEPLLQHLRLITFAESLGGPESFITYPATQTHADIPEEIRTANGVCNRLLRFSVGIEHVYDLIDDLELAFSGMKEAKAVQ